MSKSIDVLNVIKSWIGYSESNGRQKLIVDTYNSIKPLPVGYKLKYTDAWCAATVSAAAFQAGITDFPFECSCSRQIELLKKSNCWVENDAYTPKPGDLIYYDWDDNGIGDNTGSPDHVGMVENVIGNTATIIEGNMSNAVGRRNIILNQKSIRGYGVPSYNKNESDAIIEAVNAIYSIGVISSPDYWINIIKAKNISSINPQFFENLEYLFLKFSDYTKSNK